MAKTLAEQISDWESKHAATALRMETLMEESNTKGETLDAEQSEEYDGLQATLKSVNEHLARLRELETVKATTAKPVTAVDTQKAGSDSRAGIVVIRNQKLDPGVRFARYAKVKAVSRLESERMIDVATKMYGADSEVAMFITKANEVFAGSTVTGNWAANLVGAETSMFADFAEYLRPATILGKFGQNGIPGLRSVEFRTPLISQTGGGDSYWVGEGKPKPLTSFTFARTTMEPTKIANIAVLTEESIRSSNPKSDTVVARSLRDALVAGQDVAFIDPANAGTASIKPASITNGAETVASTGDDADAIRVDVRALFQKFIDADNPPEEGVWIMSTANALALSLMVNALGQREFPSVGMTGGSFEGMPIIASRYAGTYVTLANASDIYEADEGEIAVDMSRETSLEMKSATLTSDATTGVGAAMVSMFQTNSVAIRAERTINWMRRRDLGGRVPDRRFMGRCRSCIVSSTRAASGPPAFSSFKEGVTMKLTATRSFVYGTRRLLPGDVFDVSPRHGKLLLIAKKATDQGQREPGKIAPPPTGLKAKAKAKVQAKPKAKPAAAPPPPVEDTVPAMTTETLRGTDTPSLPTDDQGDDLVSLRQAYKTKFGKSPFMGWSAATLKDKLAGADE